MTKDFKAVDQVKRNILNLYREDIYKHANKNRLKVERIFDEIPSQLQKHEKKFVLSSVDDNARYREYEEALFWLEDSMLVNICYNNTEPSIGLNLKKDNISYKCYMADTGLFLSHSFDENGLVSEKYIKKFFLINWNLTKE